MFLSQQQPEGQILPTGRLGSGFFILPAVGQKEAANKIKNFIHRFSSMVPAPLKVQPGSHDLYDRGEVPAGSKVSPPYE